MELKHQMIYKCADCGHAIEAIFAQAGGFELRCCGKAMPGTDKTTSGGATERHLPVIEPLDDGIRVRIGTLPHPMDTDHWIQFIEVTARDGLSMRKELSPGDQPEAPFNISLSNVSGVRDLCNRHGLWSA